MTGDLETFDVVRWYDPDIVAHNTTQACSKYSTERDLTKLVIPSEAAPIIFTCRLLTRAQRRMVRRQPTEPDQYDMAFRFGVVSIANLPSSTGARVLIPARARPDEPITDETMDQIGLSEDDEQEIGSVILAKSFLARGVPLSCRQLDSSLHAFSVVAVLHAERKRGSQTPMDESSES